MSEIHDDYCYLTMIGGSRMGTNFLLDPQRANRIGRGSDCEIVLVDPGCSRVHAQFVRDEQGWWMVDKGSRNGVFLDTQRVDRARLVDGSRFHIGVAVFVVYQTADHPTLAAERVYGAV